MRKAERAWTGRVRVVGMAAELPPLIRSSTDVEGMIDEASSQYRVPPGVIRHVTGIDTRRVAGDEVNASDLAAGAIRRLFGQTGTAASDVDLLIFAAASQDLAEPATAAIVSDKAGLACPAFDVKNACNSFLNGLQVADALLRSGAGETAIVAAGEIPSRAIKFAVDDREDLRLSFPGYTFGDAGAAALLTRSEESGGIFYSCFRTECSHWSAGVLAGGGTMHPRGDEWTYFRGDGSQLRTAFAAVGPALLSEALRATDTTLDDFVRVFVHQVTVPFLRDFQDVTGVRDDQLEPVVRRYGNMAAASLPVQWSLAQQRRHIRRGDRVALVGLAGGISLGVMLVEV